MGILNGFEKRYGSLRRNDWTEESGDSKFIRAYELIGALGEGVLTKGILNTISYNDLVE